MRHIFKVEKIATICNSCNTISKIIEVPYCNENNFYARKFHEIYSSAYIISNLNNIFIINDDIAKSMDWEIIDKQIYCQSCVSKIIMESVLT